MYYRLHKTYWGLFNIHVNINLPIFTPFSLTWTDVDISLSPWGAFKNYVDQILDFFKPPSPLVDNFT